MSPDPASSLLPPVVNRPCRVAGALVLLCFVFVIAPITAQTPPAEAPKAPAETLRPEIAKPLKAAQDAINAKQFREALVKLAEAELISGKTPYESYVLERMRGPAAAALGEHALAGRAFLVAFESGRLTKAERTQFAEAISSAFYLQKDFKQSAIWGRRALQEGGASPRTRLLMIQALILSDDFAPAAKELSTLIAENDAAGVAPTQEVLRLLGSTAQRLKDETLYLNTLERLVILYATNDYWMDFIARIARQPNFTDRYLADVFRLKLVLGQPLTASQYLFVAQSAKQAGFPIEASRIVEAGYKSGVLGSSPEHKTLRDAVAKDAADDLKNMARTSVDAEKLKEGPALFNSGLNYVYAGEPDKGLPMMEQGILRPGIRRPEDARLRLGIAYALAGNRAKALEALAAVNGGEGATDAARLWVAYAKQPAKTAP
jgi:hypothetical protein